MIITHQICNSSTRLPRRSEAVRREEPAEIIRNHSISSSKHGKNGYILGKHGKIHENPQTNGGYIGKKNHRTWDQFQQSFLIVRGFAGLSQLMDHDHRPMGVSNILQMVPLVNIQKTMENHHF